VRPAACPFSPLWQWGEAGDGGDSDSEEEDLSST